MINDSSPPSNYPVKVAVIGASTNPSRTSFRAINQLISLGYDVVAIGSRKGTIGSVEILSNKFPSVEVHTITMYVGALRQEALIPQLLSLKPKRIIFNPGAENPKIYDRFRRYKIEVVEACTLVLLSIGTFLD